MKTPMLEYVRARLPETYRELEVISEGSGVPFHTLLKIRTGETPNPRIGTLQPVYDYIRENYRKLPRKHAP